MIKRAAASHHINININTRRLHVRMVDAVMHGMMVHFGHCFLISNSNRWQLYLQEATQNYANRNGDMPESRTESLGVDSSLRLFIHAGSLHYQTSDHHHHTKSACWTRREMLVPRV